MKKISFAALLFVIAAGIAITIWLKSTASPPPETSIPLTALLQDANGGFARPNTSWQFSFPRDHGAHPDYRTESWYFTGHLTTPRGRRFGFQLTFFRLALAPEPPPLDSAWATNQVYRSHFAITDEGRRQFQAFERFNRAALGLSGATFEPMRVWLENWSLDIPITAEANHFQLKAAADRISLDLQLQISKPLVPVSSDATSTSFIPGGAFYGYLVSRLIGQGNLSIAGENHSIEGVAWLDRAWGEVPLSRGQIALNRFTLQLDDGREILCVQLHRRDGSRAPVTTGLLIHKDGSSLGLGRRDLTLESLDHWESPDDRARYPARWHLRIPAETIDLEIIPTIADQEVHFSIRYWSGTVRVMGTVNHQPLTGNGHVELTGYAEPVSRH